MPIPIPFPIFMGAYQMSPVEGFISLCSAIVFVFLIVYDSNRSFTDVSIYSLGVCGKCRTLLRYTNNSALSKFFGGETFDGYFCPCCGKKISHLDFGYDENGRKEKFPRKKMSGYYLGHVGWKEDYLLMGKAFPLCSQKLTFTDKVKARFLRKYPVINIGYVCAITDDGFFSPLNPAHHSPDQVKKTFS